MTLSTATAVTASNVTPSTSPGCWDVEITITRAGVTTRGAAELRPSAYDGAPSSWGDRDMWLGGRIVDLLATLEDGKARALCDTIEAEAASAIVASGCEPSAAE